MNLFKAAYSFIVRPWTVGAAQDVLNDQVHAGVPVNEPIALGLSATWACVNLLAGTIASLPLMVYRTDASGARTVARDHPLYRVLHDAPNYDQTAMDFWEGGNATLELRGNMHAYKGRTGGQITSLTPIYDPRVTRLTNGDLHYRWYDRGKMYEADQEDVLHIRGFGGGPEGGLSTLSYGRQVFGLTSAINIAAQRTFANGLRPSVNVAFEKFLTPEQRADIEKGLAAKYAGAMKAGTPFVTEGGSKINTLSINPEDAQMLESRAFGVEEICRFFGVPPFMVGHNEKASGYPASLDGQVLMFQKFTLRRRLKRIEQALEQQLLTPRDRAEGITIEFNLEGLLRGDSAGRSAFYQSALANGWMTINEVRALENMPPVEGGEVPRMQIQNVPITEAGKITRIAAPSA